MSNELEYTVQVTRGNKTYEGRRVVTTKGDEATQYVTTDEVMDTKTDPMTYKSPFNEQQMEIGAKLIFAELLQENGIIQ